MLSKYWLNRLAIVTLFSLLAAGSAMASMEAGFAAFQEGNYQAALDAWRAEAEKGNPTAQFNVGQLYRLGKGVVQDDQLAARWYRRAAAQGYAPAERNLQLMAAEGRLATVEDQTQPSEPLGAGIPGAQAGTVDAPAARSREEPGLTAFQDGDFRQAMDTWLPLAAQGDATAQFNLGQLHRLGKGVQQSDREAIRWYRRAALQGHAMALHNLELMYGDGRVPAEEQQAVESILTGLNSKDSEKPSLAASALAERTPTESTVRPSAKPAGPPAGDNTGIPSVQMVSQPMIANATASSPPAVPPVPATPKAPTPAEVSPVVSRRAMQMPPPVPRPRPVVARRDTSKIPAASMALSPTPPVADAVPSVPDTVTAPEAPARVKALVASEPQAKPAEKPLDVSTAGESQVARLEPSQAKAKSSRTSQRASRNRIGNLVTVAEVLDMNSLVVEVEAVPVAAVTAVPAGSNATVSSPGSVSEPISVAAVGTTTLEPRSREEPPAAGGKSEVTAITGETASQGGLLRGKDWLQDQDPEFYLIQIMASNRRTHLESFLDTLPTLDQPVSLVATARRGRPWYVLLLGPYSGLSSARAVLDKLEDSVKINGPWIRQVGKIQSVMR